MLSRSGDVGLDSLAIGIEPTVGFENVLSLVAEVLPDGDSEPVEPSLAQVPLAVKPKFAGDLLIRRLPAALQ